ncbi:MAG: YihY/virulence factor BrkB family protein [Paraglaciecola polaris]|uniref:YihY/virulence factor BrkB family protein n=1 Tax=Paraglaciecola polaris TaxID=222814 RepID=UPI0030029CC5
MKVNRGQHANSPQDIPLRGWWDILRRTMKKMLDDNLSLIAAGVGFYFLLAVFPMLAAFISVYGLVVSADELQQHLNHLIGVVPAQSREIILSQVSRIMGKSEAALSTGALLSTLFAVWSASKGAQAMVTACNITYEQRQNRGFLMMVFMRIALTLSAVILLAGALFSIALMPILFTYVGLKDYSSLLVQWLTWPFLAVLFNLALAAFYRYGPHRRRAKWRWVTPGSVMASLLWIAFSFAFSFYLGQFGQYDKTYGSLGSVVVLLMWFYLTAYIVLLGAEFNAAMEHQTEQDSTHGSDKVLGERGAVVADTRPDDLVDK